jgi:hypothetical protein
MRKLFLLLCIAVALSTVGLFIISYAGGRAGMPFSVLNLPAEIVPYLINLSCIAALLVLLFVAMARRKHVGLGLKVLLFSIAFAASSFVLPPNKMFQSGFRARIKATISADELRQIARTFEQNVPPKGFLPGPKKRSLWTQEEHGQLWTKMTNSTSLGKLDAWVVIYEKPNMVELSWGGGMIGHWGVRIEDSPTTHGDIAPGITTFDSD